MIAELRREFAAYHIDFIGDPKHSVRDKLGLAQESSFYTLELGKKYSTWYPAER
ncbi:MAG: hypothetical protein JSU72_02270 [Deltaproteobacteria bacterium]|nr:MAG: hypothetical protein JSU72_02270 [Deltaproteobacteria bacterium]